MRRFVLRDRLIMKRCHIPLTALEDGVSRFVKSKIDKHIAAGLDHFLWQTPLLCSDIPTMPTSFEVYGGVRHSREGRG